MSRPTGIDLFAGAGGLSLGFERAGFDVVAAVEIDPVHACVHKFNFPDCAVIPRSIAKLSGNDIRRAAGLGDRPVDVVFGGPPCQGFSLIGHRALDDPRNSLVGDFVRIVSELGARYFVFENVKGLTVGRHRRFLEEVIGAFGDAGYELRLPWKVLNAAHFETPQNRERLILFGARRGLALPRYPEPASSAGDSRRGLFGASPTCRDALSDLPDAEDYPELVSGDEASAAAWGSPSRYARRLRCLDNDAWAFGYPRVWNPDVLTCSARTDHTPISRHRFARTAPGAVEPISRFFKLPADGVSNTLRAGTDSARGAFTSPRPIHYERPRCVTVREMARLHGFPDWFRFHWTKWHGARQIGNAVPPPLSQAVAAAVIEAMGIAPTRPTKAVALGDVALLRMDASQAAAFLGIENPIGRRDKKSGARKRKQCDIEFDAAPLAEARGCHG